MRENESTQKGHDDERVCEVATARRKPSIIIVVVRKARNAALRKWHFVMLLTFDGRSVVDPHPAEIVRCVGCVLVWPSVLLR